MVCRVSFGECEQFDKNAKRGNARRMCESIVTSNGSRRLSMLRPREMHMAASAVASIVTCDDVIDLLSRRVDENCPPRCTRRRHACTRVRVSALWAGSLRILRADYNASYTQTDNGRLKAVNKVPLHSI